MRKFWRDPREISRPHFATSVTRKARVRARSGPPSEPSAARASIRQTGAEGPPGRIEPLKRQQRVTGAVTRCSEAGGGEEAPPTCEVQEAEADAVAESLAWALLDRGHSIRCLMMRRLSA